MPKPKKTELFRIYYCKYQGPIWDQQDKNMAQIGGLLPHLVNDYDQVWVKNSEDLVVLSYDRTGL